MDIFIGRQPIFNREEEIVAYELLYRDNNKNYFPDIDADSATIEVIINSFLSIGIQDVTYGNPSFVNFTENLIMSETLTFLDSTKIVIEILEGIPITEHLIERIKILKQQGYKIALDDFIMEDTVLLYDDLFQYIDYIKIDFLATPLNKRSEMEHKIKTQFPSIKLLAEKVETREAYEAGKQAGYSLFQGYFFEKPKIIKSTDIPPNLMQYFQIIVILRNEELDIDLLAENIEREISLTYKLMQLINNSAKRTKSKVRSIKQAILLLGLADLRKWIYLLAMRESKLQHHPDVLNELLYASLFRAKVCEKLARRNFKQNFSEYFLVGMFSLIDSILQRPLHEILCQLPLSDVLVETISGTTTEMTPYLQLSTALNKLNWDEVEPLAAQLSVSSHELNEIYEETIEWVNDAFIINK